MENSMACRIPRALFSLSKIWVLKRVLTMNILLFYSTPVIFACRLLFQEHFWDVRTKLVTYVQKKCTYLGARHS